MDKWNRYDQNEYTGISAQRRNRRRTDNEPFIPESTSGTVSRERSASVTGAEPLSASAAFPGKESSEKIRRFMRPENPAAAVESEEPEEFDRFEGVDSAEADTKPEEFLESEAPDEPEAADDVAPDEPEEPEETDKSGEPDESDEPEEPEETDASDKPVRPVMPLNQETRVEPVYVAQDADSRVPPEARRMAATPYGIAGTAEHSAAGSQATRRQPVQPEERKPSVRPRYDSSAAAGRNAAGRNAAGAQRARVHVGYAPGRMSDDMTQQIPTGESVRESLYTRDARAYLEKRKQPFRVEDNGRQTQDRPGARALRIIVTLLVVAGAVLTGMLLQKNRNTPNGTPVRSAPQVFSFKAVNMEGATAPTELIFSAQTDTSVQGIRLRGENDTDLDTVPYSVNNADGIEWQINFNVETGYSGTVRLQVRRGEEEGWYDTDYTAEVNVSGLPGAEPEETPVPEEEPDDDYWDPDEEESGETETEEGAAAPVTGEEDPEQESGEETGEETGEEPEEEPEEEPAWQTEEKTGGEPVDEGELPAGALRTQIPTDTPAPATPEPTTTPALTAEAAPNADPSLITSTTVYTNGSKKTKSYSRPAKELIHMPAADEYTKRQLGVLTFRGDNFRRNAAVGTLSSEPVRLSVLWQTEASSARGTNQTFYGYGWTGQAAIARWSTEVRAKSNIREDAKDEKKNKKNKRALKEVIIAGLDGTIRFLDLEDGQITRNSIKLGYPMRGTPSLHSRGYPYMAVGQFARKMRGKTGKIGLRKYNLFTQAELKMIDGLDGKLHRPLNNVGSFETSALIDRESDTLIAIGTNGMLYLESLGSTFDYNTGVMTVSPSTTVMVSKAKGQKNNALVAVESSPAAYDKYVYYADMGGVLRCVDTNTLTPVWAVETGDSVMASIAMDLTESRELNLYTANMLNNRKKGNSNIQIRRYDALSGKEAWCTDIGVYKGKKDKDDVGAKASPVIGQHALNDLVYFTVTGLSDDGVSKLGLRGEVKAALIALEKETGRIVWSYGLSSRSESSPIALYDDAGNGWILQCEQNGYVHLLDGLTGSVVSSLDLKAEIEASPAAYNNVVVIGTTGKGTSYVYGIKVELANAQENTRDDSQPAAQNDTPDDDTMDDDTMDDSTPEDDTPDDETQDEMPDDMEEGGTDDEEVPGGA